MERLTNSIDFCQMHCENCFFKDKSHCYENNLYNRLREYEIAEEQGLLIRLPCKVGSTIYKVYQKPTRCTAHGTFRDDYTCCGCEELECDSSYEWAIYECVADVKELICVSDKIGKTVFLTKEEAETALKDMQGV